MAVESYDCEHTGCRFAKSLRVHLAAAPTNDNGDDMQRR